MFCRSPTVLFLGRSALPFPRPQQNKKNVKSWRGKSRRRKKRWPAPVKWMCRCFRLLFAFFRVAFSDRHLDLPVSKPQRAPTGLMLQENRKSRAKRFVKENWKETFQKAFCSIRLELRSNGPEALIKQSLLVRRPSFEFWIRNTFFFLRFLSQEFCSETFLEF